MSFQTMIAEVHGAVPKISIDYAKTLVNRAWKDTRRKSLWSFQMFDTNWVTANLLGNTTNSTPLFCNVTLGSNQVVFNANAANAINNIGIGPYPPPVTQQQFRVGVSTIYNIWAWDGNNTATLDRPYTDSSNNNTSFTIGSYYMTVPYSDFTRFLSVVDMQDFTPLSLNTTREQITKRDPQLTMYMSWPTDCVPIDNDLNANSNTYGYWRYLLWGLPQVQRAYQLLGIREGADLSLPTDTLPFAVGEDCILALAKAYAYEYAESIKGESPRDQGPDWRFLIGMEMKNYDRLFREYRMRDREKVDNFFVAYRSLGGAVNAPYFQSIGNVAWPGLPW